MHRLSLRILTVLALAILPAAAQLPSNASLQGAYYVRYLGVIGTPSDFPVSFSGTLTFDGKGGFQATGAGIYHNKSDLTLTLVGTGTYSVFSSGALSLTNPFAPSGSGTFLFGGIGGGGFVASSTDSGYCDLLVATPIASNTTNATLSGTYQVADLEFAGGNLTGSTNAFFAMTADGKGGVGTISASGSSQALKDQGATQSLTGATYSISTNGSGTLTIPAISGISNQLISGTKTLYVAPDGSYFISGSATGYDIQVGVKAVTGSVTTALQGIYFAAQLENFVGDNVYGYEGASNELASTSTELIHWRIQPDGFAAYDSTSADSFTPNADGTAGSLADGFQFAIGGGGNLFIVVGGEGDYYMGVGMKIPPLSGTGVFLNPTAVVNAASYAPFTAQLSPGELLVLGGSGMASALTVAGSLPFPTTLDNVQVMVNGAPAPIYYVSPTQLSVVVPYTVPQDGTPIPIQVINNGTSSNTVQWYTGMTSPGVFTLANNGLGDGAILHADFSVVNSSSPAKAGETVLIFVNGLGAVKPAVNAGSAAPSSAPLSLATNPVDVYIDGTKGTVSYQGLAPGLAGLYQLNVAIPSGVSTGALSVEISTVDGDNLQATIQVK